VDRTLDEAEIVTPSLLDMDINTNYSILIECDQKVISLLPLMAFREISFQGR
jgi:hypothetical protein